MKINQDNNISITDNMYYICRTILIICLPLAIISALFLSLPHISADNPDNSSGSSTDSLSFSISSSCTLSSVVNGDHSAELINGTYKDNIGKSTITTLCNDGNGYSIYANGYSNDEEGNNNLINTANSNFSIPTGLATSGLDSNWAMSLNNVVNDTSPTPPVIEEDYDGIYGLVPNEWTKVASLPSSATDMSQGPSFTTTYAVYTSSSQTAGTYNGKVKYILVHPSYKPAVYFMQDVDQWKNLIGMEESIQAVDRRDGKAYWVTKLKDGNIWMTQNLDLDIGGTGVAALNSNNTDISTNPNVYTSSGIYSDYTENNGVHTWNPVSTAITSNYYLSGNTVKPSAWPTNNYTTPYSLEGGEAYVYSSGSSSNDTRYTTLASCATSGRTEAECKRYATGNFYNWSAAIASNNSANISTVEAIASNSICPKGWRLPNASQTDNVNNEFGRMLYKAGITLNLSAGNESVGYATGGFNKLRSSPYYFVRSGGIEGGTLGGSGDYGFYWSSTVSSSTNAYYLRFNGTGIYPARNYVRDNGYPIRCVAR